MNNLFINAQWKYDEDVVSRVASIFDVCLVQSATKRKAQRKEIFKRAEQYVAEYRQQVSSSASSIPLQSSSSS